MLRQFNVYIRLVINKLKKTDMLKKKRKNGLSASRPVKLGSSKCSFSVSLRSNAKICSLLMTEHFVVVHPRTD